MRRILIGAAVISLALANASPVNALTLPKSFEKYASSPFLAKPGILILNPTTQEPVFSDQPDSLRAPASVLKLLSTTTAIKTLGAETTFKTRAYKISSRTFALVGESDPWLTSSKFEADKYKRAFTPYLINKILQTNPHMRSITLKTSGVYQKDLQIVQRYFRHMLTIHLLPLNSEEQQALTEDHFLGQITSPTVSDIVQFTLLWSDNVLADRLARTSAKKLGYTTDGVGIQNAFVSTLDSLEVPTSGMQIIDGNGLSHENRVSPRTIATLLMKIKDNPTYAPVVEGLPTAGISGTLKNRFINDAPQAVGLIQAKTGWINTAVSLAGYVDVGNEKYAFAVIADHVKPYERYRALAREAIDKMLGTIAAPPTTS